MAGTHGDEESHSGIKYIDAKTEGSLQKVIFEGKGRMDPTGTGTTYGNENENGIPYTGGEFNETKFELVNASPFRTPGSVSYRLVPLTNAKIAARAAKTASNSLALRKLMAEAEEERKMRNKERENRYREGREYFEKKEKQRIANAEFEKDRLGSVYGKGGRRRRTRRKTRKSRRNRTRK